MGNKENKETFHYTYSAREQAELKAIREKYSPKEEEEDKMAMLRRLDASVTKKGTIVSLVLGIFGAIIMGSGMSLVMTEIGIILGIAHTLFIGVIVGIIGMIMVILAYPVYNYLVKKERERLAPTIIRLADELMK